MTRPGNVVNHPLSQTKTIASYTFALPYHAGFTWTSGRVSHCEIASCLISDWHRISGLTCNGHGCLWFSGGPKFRGQNHLIDASKALTPSDSHLTCTVCRCLWSLVFSGKSRWFSRVYYYFQKTSSKCTIRGLSRKYPATYYDKKRQLLKKIQEPLYIRQ